MVCLELLKVVAGDKKIEDYRNTFANLALPLFAMAEPIPPKECKYQALKWTLWDRWTLEGDLTVQQVGAPRGNEISNRIRIAGIECVWGQPLKG